MKKIKILSILFLLLPILIFAIVLAQPGDNQPVTVPLEVLRAHPDFVQPECQLKQFSSEQQINTTLLFDFEYILDGTVVFSHTIVNPFYVCIERNCNNTYGGVVVYTPTIVSGGIYDKWQRGRWLITSTSELWVQIGIDEYGNDVYTQTGALEKEIVFCSYGQRDARGFYRVGDFVVGKLYLPIIFNSTD